MSFLFLSKTVFHGTTLFDFFIQKIFIFSNRTLVTAYYYSKARFVKLIPIWSISKKFFHFCHQNHSQKLQQTKDFNTGCFVRVQTHFFTESSHNIFQFEPSLPKYLSFKIAQELGFNFSLITVKVNYLNLGTFCHLDLGHFVMVFTKACLWIEEITTLLISIYFSQ